MPFIKFTKPFQDVLVEVGAELMTVLMKSGHPVASSCGGDAVCGKCIIMINSGAENLSAPTERESFLREKLGLPANTRLSCQCHVLGDIEVDTPYW